MDVWFCSFVHEFKVGAGVSEHLLVVSYFFFETNPPLLLVGLHVEATTSDRTAYF